MPRDDLVGTTHVLVTTPDDVEGGEVRPAAEARVPALDRGFLYGDGVFETLRCYDGEPAFPERHRVRLVEALEVLGIPAHVTPAELARVVERLLEPIQGRDAYVRVSITRGDREGVLAPTETTPRLVAMARGLRTRRYAPARTRTATVTRPAPPLDTLKTHSTLPGVLARRGLDADEALVTNAAGELLCGSVSNLFTVEDGALVTPGSQVRLGVTREVVLELAEGMGVEVREGPVDLEAAEAAFLTNTTWGVRPVREHDDRELEPDHGLVEDLAEAYLQRALAGPEA